MSSLMNVFFSRGNQDFKLLMIGLDSAGKTTILYKMKLNDVVSAAPTIGFNLEEINVNNVKIKVWDLSGQERMRSVWKHYFESVNGVIFVIDSSDVARINDARDELHSIIAEALGVPILILANKQDKPGALSYFELRDQLALRGDTECRGGIRVQETSAIQNKGLKEGFEWIAKQITKKK